MSNVPIKWIYINMINGCAHWRHGMPGDGSDRITKNIDVKKIMLSHRAAALSWAEYKTYHRDSKNLPEVKQV